MRRLRHGYTNLSRRRNGIVEKTYIGTDAAERSARELACLSTLAGRLPVPEVIDHDPSGPLLRMREVRGAHGQDLIDAAQSAEVLTLLGGLLAQLQQIAPATVPGLPGCGEVVVHGDFGPQNVLIVDHRVAALLDWEFAHVGRPIEDLAWTEWIVRMHHPAAQDGLSVFFEAAQFRPAWTDRQAAMVERCVELVRSAEQHGSPESVELWSTRLALAESWSE